MQEQLTESRPAVLAEEAGDVVSHTLGAGEDEDLVLVVLALHNLLEVLDHLVALLALRDDLDNLSDAVVGRQIHGTDVDLDEVGKEVGSQVPDLLGPSGRPHEGLAIRANLADDLANLGLETHIKHAISFVEDQVSHTTKVGLARFEHVNQAARGGDAHLDAALEVTDLRTLGDTAVDAGVADARRLAELCDFLLNLNSQFTGRSENQDNRAVAGSEEGLSVDVNDGGKAVGQGLARARLSNTDHVATGKSHRPALRLNGGGGRETLGLDLIHDVAREASLIEGLDGLGDIAAGDGHGVFAAELVDISLRTVADVGMLLVERLFKLGKRVQVPVLLLQTSAEA